MFLIPLFILIFAGASVAFSPDLSSQQELRQAGANVLTVVDDPARRADVEKTVIGILDESSRFNSAFEVARKQIKKQYQDHSSGADEALAVLSQFNSEWESAQEQMADLQFELRKQLTKDEWNEIYGPSE